MDIYNQLVKYPIFTIHEVEKLSGKSKTAYSKIERLMKKGLVKKIRKNIYSPINPFNDQIVATRYQIACAITDTAYISHHSAFEYYGLTDQVLPVVYVSSETKFNHFEYDKVIYKFVASKIKEGIVLEKNMAGVYITDLERTVIDSIHDFSKSGGFNELLKCLEKIDYLDESKLLLYLKIYNIQGLYQRVGYILQNYQEKMHISNSFINFCKEKVGNSRQYLLKESMEGSIYNREWKIMVPGGLFKKQN